MLHRSSLIRRNFPALRIIRAAVKLSPGPGAIFGSTQNHAQAALRAIRGSLGGWALRSSREIRFTLRRHRLTLQVGARPERPFEKGAQLGGVIGDLNRDVDQGQLGRLKNAVHKIVALLALWPPVAAVIQLDGKAWSHPLRLADQEIHPPARHGVESIGTQTSTEERRSFFPEQTRPICFICVNQ